MRVVTFSTNSITGDLVNNTNNIINRINITSSNADMIVFPETCISGYCCGSLWDVPKFIEDQLEQLNRIVEVSKYNNSIIVLGYVRMEGLDKLGFPILYNSAAVIYKGELQSYDKQLLATKDHHEDSKYFVPGKETKIFNINGLSFGVLVCEDAWYTDHERNLPKEMVDMGAEFLISINQSYFYYDKLNIRKHLFLSIAINNNVPVIAVNSVGLGDIVKNIVIYDGGTLAFNSSGFLCEETKRFEESIGIIPDVFKMIPIKNNSTDKYKEIFNALVFEQKEFFKLSGIKNAQVHISGGIDSAIVACIVKEAMPHNLVFITNSTKLNSKSLKYVKHLETTLNVKIHSDWLQDTYDTFVGSHTNAFKDTNTELPLCGLSCAQAVLRTVQGLVATHRFKSGIVSTGNHTEIVLGWATFHDIGSIGVHMPLGDLSKTELFELAKYINDEYYYREVIPEDLYNGIYKPSAELPDANEDPIDYLVQSGLCTELIRKRKTADELINEFNSKKLNEDSFVNLNYVYSLGIDKFKEEIKFTLNKASISVYKAAQSAPIVIMSPRSRGFSNRETLINKYKQIL